MTDARGKTLHIKEKPKRIISTYIFADEILLDLVSHDRIVAMDNGSTTRVYLWQSRVQRMSRQRSITVLST